MNKLIMNTLEPIGLPVAFKTYNGSQSEYIIFNYWSTPLVHADNEEIITNYTVQIDYFTPGNFLNTAKQIEQLMKNAGFMRKMDDSEYNDKTKVFRYFTRFSYAMKRN